MFNNDKSLFTGTGQTGKERQICGRVGNHSYLTDTRESLWQVTDFLTYPARFKGL